MVQGIILCVLVSAIAIPVFVAVLVFLHILSGRPIDDLGKCEYGVEGCDGGGRCCADCDVHRYP
jgi:hypothetical protein